MWETRVQCLGQETPLEKEMATHSSILAWRITWREEPGRLQSMGSQRVGHGWVTSLQTAKDRRTVQRHTEPINTPKPTTGHHTALQRDKIQLHWPEHRHTFPQPGKPHRMLTRPRPWGQPPQPRLTTTLKTLFFLMNHTVYSPYKFLPSQYPFQCCEVFLFVFLVKKFFLRFFSPFYCDFFLILCLICLISFLIVLC